MAVSVLLCYISVTIAGELMAPGGRKRTELMRVFEATAVVVISPSHEAAAVVVSYSHYDVVLCHAIWLCRSALKAVCTLAAYCSHACTCGWELPDFSGCALQQ